MSLLAHEGFSITFKTPPIYIFSTTERGPIGGGSSQCWFEGCRHGERFADELMEELGALPEEYVYRHSGWKLTRIPKSTSVKMIVNRSHWKVAISPIYGSFWSKFFLLKGNRSGFSDFLIHGDWVVNAQTEHSAFLVYLPVMQAERPKLSKRSNIRLYATTKNRL